MLQKMRSGAQSTIIKVVLFGLLMLAMLGLAFTDVQGMFRSGGAATGSTAVAEIGNSRISAAELDMLVQRNMRQPNIDEGTRRAIPLITLNQEVNARVYAQAAHDLGLVLDNKTAAAILKKDVLGPVAASAGISEKQALQGMLRNAGMSEQAFVGAFKNQVATDQLVRIINTPAQAPAQLVNDALKRRYELRRGEYFELTAADLGDALKTPPTDEELQSYYTSIAGSFLLPEYRDFSVLIIDRNALGLADNKPTAEEVESYYNENKDNFGAPEERRVEQIIAPDEATAQALLSKAQAGATLEAIAQQAETAEGAAADVVFATSTYRQSELDIELATPAFKAKANALVGPVETPLGWHIMKIVAITPARTPALSEMRAEIEKEIAEERGADTLYARATEIDEQVAAGQSLSDIAAQLKLQPVNYSGVTSEGTDKAGKPVDTKVAAFSKIVETAYTLDEGQVSSLAETSDGQFLLIETTKITPAQEQPFEAVRSEVTDSLRLKKMGELFDQRSAEITEKMQLGESFDAVAKRLGKRVSSTPLLKRSSTPAEAGMARGMLPALFSLDSVGQTTAVSGNEKVTILRLAERKIETPRDARQQDSAALRNTLNEALRNDILEQYRNHLFREYGVSINEDVVSRIYAPRSETESVE